MDVREFCRFRAPGVDDDHRALRVFAEVTQGIAGIGNSVRLKRIGTDEKNVIGVFDVFRGMTGLVPKKAPIEPEIAGLFLTERIVRKTAFHRRKQLAGVRSAEVVALTSTADEGKRIAAMFFANAQQTHGNVRQSFVPAHPDKRAVRLAFERMLQAIVVVLVMLEPCRLLAKIPFGNRVVVIAADPGELVPVDIDAQATIA
jgi:hypothetical protein